MRRDADRGGQPVTGHCVCASLITISVLTFDTVILTNHHMYEERAVDWYLYLTHTRTNAWLVEAGHRFAQCGVVRRPAHDLPHVTHSTGRLHKVRDDRSVVGVAVAPAVFDAPEVGHAATAGIDDRQRAPARHVAQPEPERGVLIMASDFEARIRACDEDANNVGAHAACIVYLAYAEFAYAMRPTMETFQVCQKQAGRNHE